MHRSAYKYIVVTVLYRRLTLWLDRLEIGRWLLYQHCLKSRRRAVDMTFVTWTRYGLPSVPLSLKRVLHGKKWTNLQNIWSLFKFENKQENHWNCPSSSGAKMTLLLTVCSVQVESLHTSTSTLSCIMYTIVMLCVEKFGLQKKTRRHHCRACGVLVCERYLWTHHWWLCIIVLCFV